MKKIFSCFFIAVLILMSLFTVSCTTSTTATLINQNINTTQINDGSIKVVWSSTFENRRIQDINGVVVKFEYFDNGKLISNDVQDKYNKYYYQNITIKSGSKITQSGYFIIDSDALTEMHVNINSLTITWDYWSIMSFASIWSSNEILIIAVIATLSLFIIIGLIVGFVDSDLEGSDYFEWIGDRMYIIYTFIPFAIITIPIFTLLFATWFMTIMIFCILISIIFAPLLGMYISKGIVLLFEFIADLFDDISWSRDKNYEYGKSDLMEMNVSELKNIASSLEITNYSKMLKNELIKAILKAQNHIEYYEIQDLEKMNIGDLKQIANKHGISGYYKMTKSQLIKQIIEIQDDEESDNEDNLESSKSSSSTIKQSSPDEDILKKSKNGITLNDIAGLQQAKQAIEEKVILPFKHKNLFDKYNKKTGGGILLYGPPGTGKTMFAEAVANELNAHFFSIKSSDIKSKWYGESEEKIKQLFSKARKNKLSVIFFDEFEAIGRSRDQGEGDLNGDLVPEILAQIQGMGTNNHKSTLLILAATNRPWDIDSALLRPGRFDEKIYIPLPDTEARKQIFKIKLSKIQRDGIDYEYLSDITDGFNGSDVNEFCEKLKLELIKRSIKTNEEALITMQDIENVSKVVRSSVKQSDLAYFEKFNS